MIKIIKDYLNKNLFYVSVLITGILGFCTGIFYTLFKDMMFKNASSEFLEGTGVLSAYITSSTARPSETNYFTLVLLITIAFCFLICFILSLYLKKNYFAIFNLFSFVNIIWILGFICSLLFINISLIFTYIFLIIVFILYIFILYKCFNEILNLNKRQIIISLLIFLLPVIIILILFKLFV